MENMILTYEVRVNSLIEELSNVLQLYGFPDTRFVYNRVK